VDHTNLRCAAWRTKLAEELDVCLVVVSPLLRHIVFVVDGFYGAYGLTRTTVDALVGLDIEHAVALVDAVDGAFVDAGTIFEVNTWLGNDVGHGVNVTQGCGSQLTVELRAAWQWVCLA
jgi:hypothetical protein